MNSNVKYDIADADLLSNFIIVDTKIPKTDLKIAILRLRPKYLDLLKKSYLLKTQSANREYIFINTTYDLTMKDVHEIENTTSNGLRIFYRKNAMPLFDYSHFLEFNKNSPLDNNIENVLKSTFGSYDVVFPYETFDIDSNYNVLSYLVTNNDDCL